MDPRKPLIACVAAVSLLGMGGCAFIAGAAVAGGAVAAYSYISGEGSKTYARGIDAVAAASEAALKQKDIIVINKAVGGTQGQIKGRLRDDTAVTVNLQAETPEATRVKIRIGTFGDETRTKMLFHEIDKELGIPSSPPPGTE